MLSDHLRGHGIKVWLDEAEINIGDSLTKKIGKAIEDADFVGAVLSHNSINSEWVQRELQIALQKEIEEKKVIVLPILIETVKMPPFLEGKLYADFTTPKKFKKELRKLLRALGVSVKKEKKRIETQPVEILKERPKILFDYPTEIVKLVGMRPPSPTPAERKLTTFEDIKIVEIDDSKSYKPDPLKLLYNIYLKLSASPPLEWQQIFEAERRFPRHTTWRDAWIEGEYIIVYCIPHEIEKHHADDLKEDTRNSNLKYRQYLMEEAQKEAEKREQALSESNQIKKLKQKIRFD